MCICPLMLKDNNGLVRMVACGQCRACRLMRKRAWAGRLRLERMEHQFARFLTLTYEDDPGILQVDDLQRFMKRYRHHYGECRYFGVGEYGEKNKRGHWHVLIFGHGPQVMGHWLDNKAWSMGYSYDGDCNSASITYCAGYMLKGGDDKDHRPVTRMSLKPGIGFERIAAMARRAAPYPLGSWPKFFTIGDRKYPLIEGGLACFQKAFIEAGGVAPLVPTPEERDYLARLDVSDWGPRLRAEGQVSALTYRENCDVYASPKTPKKHGPSPK